MSISSTVKQPVLIVPTVTDTRTIVPVDVYSRTINGYIAVPIFNIQAKTAWLGASRILAQFSYDVSEPVNIIALPTFPNNTFILCVRWIIDGVLYRYKLVEDVGELLYVDLYTAERLHTHFCIEVWSTIHSEDAGALNPSEMQIALSLLHDLAKCEAGEDVQEATATQCGDLYDDVPFNPTIGEELEYSDCSACNTGDPYVFPSTPEQPNWPIIVIPPDDIDDLLGWLKADGVLYSDNGITPVINGSTIYLWVSSNAIVGSDVYQTAAPLRPTFVTNSVNSLPVVRFTTDTYMNALAFSLAQPITLFVAVKFTGQDNKQNVILCSEPLVVLAPPAAPFVVPTAGFGRGFGNTNARLYDGTAVGVTGGTLVNNQVYIIQIELNGAASKIYIDGVLSVTGTIATSFASFVVGNPISGADSNTNADIMEITNYTRILEEDEAEGLRLYLAAKWQ